MSSKVKALLALPLVAFLALLWLFWYGLDNDPSLLPSVLLNQPLPEFEATTLYDVERTVTRDALKGEVALLNVWATWCAPCRIEHPYLVELSQRGVPVYGLNYKDERTAALAWLNDLGDPYRMVLFDQDGLLGIDLGVYGAPETFILDRDGIIRHRHVGVLDEQVWHQELLPRIERLQQEQAG